MTAQLSRRFVLKGLALAGAPVGFEDVAAALVAPDSLASIATKAGIQFGASMSANLPSDYAKLYIDQTSIATTDTALKFDHLRPNAGTYDFAQADQILQFCDLHRIALRGHTLIWNENVPDWVKALGAREIERVFESHIETVVSRYRGRLHSFDVVNEPFWPLHNQPGGYRNGPWFAALGKGYVARAFRLAHSIDPTLRLCLNEAHTQTQNGWGQGIRPALLGLIDRLQDANVPLHAVGLQGHLVPQWGFDADVFAQFLADLAKRNIDIFITELDVNDATFPDDRVARDQQVAKTYAAYLAEVVKVANVKVIETWQLADRFSWYQGSADAARRAMRPLPFDAHLRPKLARQAIAEALLRRKAT